jgi:hypothetical protein
VARIFALSGWTEDACRALFMGGMAFSFGIFADTCQCDVRDEAVPGDGSGGWTHYV